MSLRLSLFKYLCVPKCQVKTNQLTATGSGCSGCVLRCCDECEKQEPSLPPDVSSIDQAYLYEKKKTKSVMLANWL